MISPATHCTEGAPIGPRTRCPAPAPISSVSSSRAPAALGEARRAGRWWFLRGEEDLGGAGDLRRVAADGGAVVIEDGALAEEVRSGEGGAGPDIRVIGLATYGLSSSTC